MAWPTLTTLIARIRALLDHSSSTALYSDAQITRWLNDGYWDIAIKTGCIENIDTFYPVTVASIRSVLFSGLRCNYVEYVPVSGAPKALIRINPNRIGHVVLVGTFPQFWFQWGQYIYIEPIPDAVYTLYTHISDYPSRDEMYDGSDQPRRLKEDYLESLIDYVLSRAFFRDKQFSKGNFHYSVYTKTIMDKKMIYQSTPAQKGRNVLKPGRIRRQG